MFWRQRVILLRTGTIPQEQRRWTYLQAEHSVAACLALGNANWIEQDVLNSDCITIVFCLSMEDVKALMRKARRPSGPGRALASSWPSEPASSMEQGQSPLPSPRASDSSEASEQDSSLAAFAAERDIDLDYLTSILASQPGRSSPVDCRHACY